MNARIIIRHPPDRYEVLVDGLLIKSIIKYCGESEFRRELNFDELPEDIKDKIIYQLYLL
jgi:hypothetical protein